MQHDESAHLAASLNFEHATTMRLKRLHIAAIVVSPSFVLPPTHIGAQGLWEKATVSLAPSPRVSVPSALAIAVDASDASLSGLQAWEKSFRGVCV